VPWVAIVPSAACTEADLRHCIRDALHGALAEQLNQWDAASQISLFNAGQTLERPGPLLVGALDLAVELYRATDGRFNPCLKV
jgi:hypothetical protein